MTTKSPDDTQGGYGTPAPEDEVPDAGQGGQQGGTELDPEALGANNGLDKAGNESTDPILQPHEASDGHLETDGVSEDDLKESTSVEPPD
ncbi:hypothetical protein ACFUCV_03175 [Specibacter sp. NPDC057265]|uniref:hypothetical protein n=1 Tax=Specibacter sp. NPDC057265 TaxID=3346075 RepID=UPI00362E3B2F